MKETIIKCDKCGKTHELQDDKRFADRTYIGWGGTYQFCKECAKTVTLFEMVEKHALASEKRTINANNG